MPPRPPAGGIPTRVPADGEGRRGAPGAAHQRRKEEPEKDDETEKNSRMAIATGTYYFTSAADVSETKVEYTYGYGQSNVFFKPTKAAKYPFRPTIAKPFWR